MTQIDGPVGEASFFGEQRNMAPSLEPGVAVVVNSRTGRIVPFQPPRSGREPHASRDDPSTYNAEGFVKAMQEHYDFANPNLWRIHDQYYDLSEYLDKHPGGRIFLEQTRGSDCTEAFEAHHVRGVSESIMARYRVDFGPKSEPSSPKRFTFEESYRKIKLFVQQFLKDELKNPTGKTTTYQGLFYMGIVAQYLCLLTLAGLYQSKLVVMVAAIALSGCWGVGHNQMHRGRGTSNPWAFLRWALDLTGFSSQSQTVTHAISHHQNTNTNYDIEIYAFNSVGLYWLTSEHRKNNPLFTMGAFWVLASFVVMIELLNRTAARLAAFRVFEADVVLPLAKLLWLLFLTERIDTAIQLYVIENMVFSLFFVPVGLSFHHAYDAETGKPLCYHEGEEGYEQDFAKHQVLSTLDHSVTFGDYWACTLFAHLNLHTVHHLFPTIDRMHHGKILQALLEHNPGGFRDLYESNDRNHKDWLTELLPGVLRQTMERTFEPIAE